MGDGIGHQRGMQQLRTSVLAEVKFGTEQVDGHHLFSCHNSVECGILMKQDGFYL
jgi:hypothetical protein